MTTTYTLTRQDLRADPNDRRSTIFISVDGSASRPVPIFTDSEDNRVPDHFVRAVEDHLNHLQLDFHLTQTFGFTVLLGKSKAVRESHIDALRKLDPRQLAFDGV